MAFPFYNNFSSLVPLLHLQIGINQSIFSTSLKGIGIFRGAVCWEPITTPQILQETEMCPDGKEIKILT